MPRLVRLCAGLHRRWDSDAVFGRLERFDVPLRLPFGRLSRGQKGAVMLALACGHTPDLLVFDDPTLGLDVVARSAMFSELITELSERGTTVLLTTHDLQTVEGLVMHVVILHRGGDCRTGRARGDQAAATGLARGCLRRPDGQSRGACCMRAMWALFSLECRRFWAAPLVATLLSLGAIGFTGAVWWRARSSRRASSRCLRSSWGARSTARARFVFAAPVPWWAMFGALRAAACS